MKSAGNFKRQTFHHNSIAELRSDAINHLKSAVMQFWRVFIKKFHFENSYCVEIELLCN